MMPVLKHRAPWLIAIGAYIIYMIVVLTPIWSTKVEPKWDGRDFNYPKFAYAVETIRSGHLPLWDPYTNCGQPFFSDPQLAWYNPAAVVAGTLRQSPFDGYVLFWTATWIWAGLGTFFLAATLGAGPVGSLIAAMLFSLSGFFVGHGQHLPHVVTAAWIPWVFAFGHRAMARESWANVLLTGVALGLSALGGYPGLVLFEVLALAIWLALAFLIPLSGPAQDLKSPLRRRLFWFIAATGIPTAILLIIWSPGLYGLLIEARDFTLRAQRPDLEEALNGNPFSFRAAISFLFPRIVIDQPGFFPADVSMNNAYIGAIGLPFAAAWVVSVGRKGWWLAALVLLWFWVSLGGDDGLRTLLHYLVPPTDYMRYNAVLRILFIAPLAVAAGLGANYTISGARAMTTTRNILCAWSLFALSAAGGMVWYFGAALNFSHVIAPTLIVCTLAAGIFFWPSARCHPKIILYALVVIIGLDVAAHLYRNSFTVWNVSPRPSIREIEAWGKNTNPAMTRDESPYYKITSLNLVNHKPVIEGFVSLTSQFNTTLVPSRFSSVLSAHRFWLSPSAWPAPPIDSGLQILGRLDAADPIPVFVSRHADSIPGQTVAPSTYGKVEIVAYEPEHLELDIYAPGPGDAMLVSTERYAPSWLVTLDGAKKEVLSVNYFFRGVRIPPGYHRVIFNYEPRAFVPLLWLSYATIAVALLAAFFLMRRENSLR